MSGPTKPIRQTATLPEGSWKAPSRDEVRAALSQSLGSDTPPSACRVVFTNMVPSCAGQIPCKKMATDRFDQLADLMRSWAHAAGRTIQNAYLDIQSGSFVAIFEIA